MPAPAYIGNTNWCIQPGSVLGIEENTVVYSIPYRGAITAVNNFRAQFTKGVDCPVVGWTHLKLESAGTITDAGTDFTTTLRFVGPDINGEFGEPDPVIDVYRSEERSIEILSTYDGNGSSTWKGQYRYKARYVIRTYIAASKQSSPSSSPGIDDPEFVALEKDFNDGDKWPDLAPTDVSTVPANLYEVKSKSEIIEQTDTGTGVWEVEEWHEKYLIAKTTPAP